MTNPAVEIPPVAVTVGGTSANVSEPTVWRTLKVGRELKSVAAKLLKGDKDFTPDDMLDMLGDDDTHDAAKTLLALFVDCDKSRLDDLTLSEAAAVASAIVDSGLLERVKEVFTRLGWNPAKMNADAQVAT